MPSKKSSAAKKTAPAARKTAKKATSTAAKRVAPAATSLKPARPAPAPRAGDATLRLPKALLAALGDNPVAAIAQLVDAGKKSGKTRSAAAGAITVFVDNAEKFYPFADSRIEDLRSWRGSAGELLAEAVKKSHRTPEEIAKAGLLREAADIVKNDFRLKSVLKTSDAATYGVTGVRDKELVSATKRYITDEGRVTPSLLKSTTGIAFRTCLRFLERRAAELDLVASEDGKTWISASRASA
jgi:hypothetical protein